MHVKVQESGDSLILQIPKSSAFASSIQNGSVVDLSLVGGKIMVTPLLESEYTLDQLLAEVADHNIHEEVNTGAAVGRELW